MSLFSYFYIFSPSYFILLVPTLPFCAFIFYYLHLPSPSSMRGLEIQKTFAPFEVNTRFYNFISGLCLRLQCITVSELPFLFFLSHSFFFFPDLGGQASVMLHTYHVVGKYIFQDGFGASGKEQSRNVFLISVKLMQTLVYQKVYKTHTLTFL